MRVEVAVEILNDSAQFHSPQGTHQFRRLVSPLAGLHAVAKCCRNKDYFIVNQDNFKETESYLSVLDVD